MHSSKSGVWRVLPMCFAFTGSLSCAYEPEHDYSIVVNWLLNGTTPTTELCDELGIKTVRLKIDKPSGKSELEGPCDRTMLLSDGVYGAFQTTRSFDFGVAYDYEVEHLDRKGKVLYSSPGFLYPDYGTPTPIELDIVDVFNPSGKQAELTAAWVFEGGTPASVAADCASLEIERVELWIASATDPMLVNDVRTLAEAECGAGEYASMGPVLATGEYVMRYVALDGRGAIAAQGDVLNVSVVEPGVVNLPRQVFSGS